MEVDFENVLENVFRSKVDIMKRGKLDPKTALDTLTVISGIDIKSIGKSPFARMLGTVGGEMSRFEKFGKKIMKSIPTTPFTDADLATYVGDYGTKDHPGMSFPALDFGLTNYTADNQKLKDNLYRDVRFSNAFRAVLTQPLTELEAIKRVEATEGFAFRLRLKWFEKSLREGAEADKWEKILKVKIKKSGNLLSLLWDEFSSEKKFAFGDAESAQGNLAIIGRWTRMGYDSGIQLANGRQELIRKLGTGKIASPWLKRGEELGKFLEAYLNSKGNPHILKDEDFAMLVKGHVGKEITTVNVHSLLAQKMSDAVAKDMDMDDLLRNDAVYLQGMRSQHTLLGIKALAAEFVLPVIKEGGFVGHLRTDRILEKEFGEILSAASWQEEAGVSKDLTAPETGKALA